MGHGLPSLSSNVSIAGGKTPLSLGCKRFGQRGSMGADQDRRDVRVLESRLWAGGKKTLAPIDVAFRTCWKQGRSGPVETGRRSRGSRHPGLSKAPVHPRVVPPGHRLLISNIGEEKGGRRDHEQDQQPSQRHGVLHSTHLPPTNNIGQEAPARKGYKRSACRRSPLRHYPENSARREVAGTPLFLTRAPASTPS